MTAPKLPKRGPAPTSPLPWAYTRDVSDGEHSGCGMLWGSAPCGGIGDTYLWSDSAAIVHRVNDWDALYAVAEQLRAERDAALADARRTSIANHNSRLCACGQPWVPASGLFGTTEETECPGCVLRRLLDTARAERDAALAELHEAYIQREDFNEPDWDSIEKFLKEAGYVEVTDDEAEGLGTQREP